MPVALLVAVVFAAEPCPAELFRIERSTNANVVLYEAKRDEAGRLKAEDPVTASWWMLADKGQRESLTFFERSMAYGFSVRAAKERAGFQLVMRALEGRQVWITERAACPVAIVVIDGREALLRKIYVKSDDRRLVPKVEWVELFGVDLGTGEPLTERLAP